VRRSNPDVADLIVWATVQTQPHVLGDLCFSFSVYSVVQKAARTLASVSQAIGVVLCTSADHAAIRSFGVWV